jgi:hypothetical protein
MKIKAFLTSVLLILAADQSLADNRQFVADVLKISPGCYPVTYDEAKDEIGVVCRGQANWTPEGVQFFSNFRDSVAYTNSIGVRSTLRWDMSNGVGPGPWLKFFFSRLDKNRIPRPQ